MNGKNNRNSNRIFPSQEKYQEMNGSGVLWVCGTPLGNLQDISQRVLGCMENAQVVVCEDTRRSLKLFNHFHVSPPKLVSLHRHSSPERMEEIVKYLEKGNQVALLADAGMPGVSDPGSELVKIAVEKGYRVEVIPGASAVTAALSLSGFPANRFLFWGFLSSSPQKRVTEIVQIARTPWTVVLFESPHRLQETFKELKKYLGDRSGAVMKELTKKHEEVWRGSVQELEAWLRETTPRGEYVIVLAPREQLQPEECQEKSPQSDHGEAEDFELLLKEDLRKLMAAGIPTSQAAKTVSLIRGVDRKRVYQLAVELKNS